MVLWLVYQFALQWYSDYTVTSYRTFQKFVQIYTSISKTTYQKEYHQQHLIKYFHCRNLLLTFHLYQKKNLGCQQQEWILEAYCHPAELPGDISNYQAQEVSHRSAHLTGGFCDKKSQLTHRTKQSPSLKPITTTNPTGKEKKKKRSQN